MSASVLFSKKIESDSKSAPLLIFHGLFGMLDNWQSVALQLSSFHTIYLIDLRNHGRSFHADDMSYDVMSQDIYTFMEAHKIGKANVLGHSLGGKAVMQFAIQYPTKVEKLIVADIAPKAYPAHHQSILKALNSVDFSMIEKRSDVEKVLEQYIPEIGVRQFLLKNVYRKDDDTYDFRFNLQSLTKHYSQLIENTIQEGIFPNPTLFLKGEKSDYIVDADSYDIQMQFPDFSIQTIPNAGHWLHADNPTDFTNAVIHFLQS